MTFINSQVAIEDLPKLEDLQLTPISPKYRTVLMTEWIITAVFLIVLAAVPIILSPNLKRGFISLAIIIPVLALILIHYTSILKGFPSRAFAIREMDVVYRSGWLIENTRAVPFRRIQNCSVQAGPLERKHGLASMVIFTAGAEGADMRIPGLEKEEAERLRQYILSIIHTGDGSTL